MTEQIERGPHGGCEPEEVRLTRNAGGPRRVPTLMGDKNDKGDDFVDFPVWFDRTGRRTATVDTGFGVVTLRAIMFDEGEMESNAGYLKALSSLLTIPEWPAEYDLALKGEKSTIEVKAGAVPPSPREIAAKADPLLARAYWDECLPPALLQQVLAAQMYLRLPPLAYVARNPQSGG